MNLKKWINEINEEIDILVSLNINIKLIIFVKQLLPKIDSNVNFRLLYRIIIKGLESNFLNK